MIFTPLKFNTLSTIKIAIEPLKPTELPKMVETQVKDTAKLLYDELSSTMPKELDKVRLDAVGSEDRLRSQLSEYAARLATAEDLLRTELSAFAARLAADEVARGHHDGKSGQNLKQELVDMLKFQATSMDITWCQKADAAQNTVDGKFQELNARLGARLEEFDRGHEQVISSLTRLGSRSARLDGADARLASVELELQGRLSMTEDIDLGQAALEMARTQQSLEVVQAAGARLLQQTLLNYL